MPDSPMKDNAPKGSAAKHGASDNASERSIHAATGSGPSIMKEVASAPSAQRPQRSLGFLSGESKLPGVPAARAALRAPSLRPEIHATARPAMGRSMSARSSLQSSPFGAASMPSPARSEVGLPPGLSGFSRLREVGGHLERVTPKGREASPRLTSGATGLPHVPSVDARPLIEG